ncbi:MAG: GntR family transcriptional regulator [Hyphomicrobiales bacterium]|nr:GntR family transcriptional regulator [Hyphomicrobiales bacterium]
MARLSNRTKEPFSEVAYRELRRRILESEMPAGFQATEQEVAELLQMSRTPTREALVRLSNEGLVEIRPRHGMRVLPVSIADMREIYDILTSLEATAAGLVAERGLSPAEMAELERSLFDMDRALLDNDLSAWAEADHRFHSLLVDFSGNGRLRAVVDTYLSQAHRVRMITLKLRPKPDQSNSEHARVVDAIKSRDGAAARRNHRIHRENAGRMLVSILQEMGLAQL